MAEADRPEGATDSGRAFAQTDTPAAPSPFDFEAIRANVNDAAAVSGGLWVSYLFVMFYLMVGAGAVTHLDLFLEKPIRLPFLSIDLPLLAFFCLAPILFLIVHAYTLIHFVILAEKAKGFHQALRISDLWAARAAGREDWRQRPDNLRRRLPNNVFVQFLAGPPETRTGPFGLMLRAISWISLAIAPILLLLLIQVQFLPYQSIAITWLHRIALSVDLVLLWWLWRKILSGRHVGSKRQLASQKLSSRVSMATGAVISLLIVLSSFLIVTFDEEVQTGYLDALKILPNRNDRSRPLSVHEFIFQSTIDEVSRKRTFPLSNTLILTNVNFMDVLGVDDVNKLKNRDYLYRARGRSFRGAIFDHAIMPKMDFFGAHLEAASFSGAELDQSNFDQAKLSGARLIGVTARGTSYDHADLSGAVLASSNLVGADFSYASLKGASLYSTDLAGVKFNGAKLNGADLGTSYIFAASFNCADLSNANLNSSAIGGSFFISSKLESADLSNAAIDASDFTNARLARVAGKTARVSRVYIGQTNKQDTIDNADLREKFEQAKTDEAQFADNQIALFKQNVCYLSSASNYILSSEVFNTLSGSRLTPLIDYILSPDCAISTSLTPKQRDDLRVKRQAGATAAYRNKFLECPSP